MNIHPLLLTGGESDLPVGQQAETKAISVTVRLAKGAHAQLRSMEESMAQVSPCTGYLGYPFYSQARNR